MRLTADQITIAVTVYDRREYLLRAIASALEQTVPVRVIVVEDCGPDSGLRAMVRDRFGDRVIYHRNSRRRGLFDNWNACVEYCSTPWLSILHDDDFLEPDFVATMLELAERLPGRGLYFGNVLAVDEREQPRKRQAQPFTDTMEAVDLKAFACENLVAFPGQLFRCDSMKALGGFRADSQYCGDWESWFRLALAEGAAHTGRRVASIRHHRSAGRGTTRVERSGRKYGLLNMQRKRNAAWLTRSGIPLRFDRREPRFQSPWAVTLLIRHGWEFSPRYLRYNLRLVRVSQPPTWWAAVFRLLSGCLGAPFARACSWLWRNGLGRWEK